MPNPENVIGKGNRFKKGETGNPKGRPPMPDLKEALTKLLSEEKNGKTALQAILTALFAKAIKGDVRAAQELLDRGFGKSPQFIEHAGELKSKFTVSIIESGKEIATSETDILESEPTL